MELRQLGQILSGSENTLKGRLYQRDYRSEFWQGKNNLPVAFSPSNYTQKVCPWHYTLWQTNLSLMFQNSVKASSKEG